MKRVLCLALAVLLVLGAVPAMASDGNVSYSGNAGNFIFSPGSEHSPTDLFPDLKGVMPGDVVHQRILIDNKADNKVKIRVYLRSLGASEESQDFLSQLSLKVEQLPGGVIYEAPADQTAQLTEWVCLGTVYSGGCVELDVTLTVPTELDNRYMNAVGLLDWEFMVEELEIEPSDPTLPPTGDDTPLGLYIGMAAGALALFLVLVIVGRKKKEDDEA